MSQNRGTTTVGVMFPKDSAAYRRVCNLLAALRGVEPVLKEHPVVEEKTDGTTNYLDKSPAALLRDEINKLLDAYTFKPSLSFTDTHAAGIHWFPTSTDRNKTATTEHTMVRLICDLHNEGKLSRLRECVCGQWFLARRDNQDCCSTRCRQKKWGQTDKGKEASQKASEAFYNRGRLHDVNNALKKWNALQARERQGNDWLTWVSKTAKVRRAFITAALEKGEITPPA